VLALRSLADATSRARLGLLFFVFASCLAWVGVLGAPALAVADTGTGAITGRVTDAGTGAPLGGIQVSALHEDGSGGYDFAFGVSTDVDGAYDLSALPAGTYKVRFADQSGDHAFQYFDGVTTLAEADDIVVKDGQTASGVDAALVEPGRITGRVTDSATHGSLEEIAVSVLQENGSGSYIKLSSTLTGADGSYSIGGLATGKYRMWFYDSSGTHVPQYYNGRTSLKSADDIEIHDADTISGIDAAMVPSIWSVYRFRNLKNGYYLWTASEVEKNNIVATMAKTWTLEGVAYRINTLSNTSPLWRFRNLKSGFYLYTSDPNEKNAIVANLSKYYKLEGVAYNVSRTTGSPVWRFQNLKDGTYLYSADPNEKANIVANLSKTWKLEGVAYLIAPWSAIGN
jgi:Carboxypeptidase regulatory-like domain/Repeat of unknown function (DUF5648)